LRLGPLAGRGRAARATLCPPRLPAEAHPSTAPSWAPGLARTLLVSTVSQVLHLSFKRNQLLPEKLEKIAGGVKGSGRVS